MRTFEYRLYPTHQQRQQLMACLKDARGLYNEMLEATKARYATEGKFLFKYDLMAAFKGRAGEHVPATTVQTLADRLDRALKRYLACKEMGIPCGFPRFKKPNRWHSIQLRQYAEHRDVWLDSDGKHLHVPAKSGLLLKVKLHRPLEGTPKTAHLVLRADGNWYALIVCEPPAQESHQETAGACPHPDIGLDVGLKVFLADSNGQTVANPRYYRTSQRTLRRKQRQMCRRKQGSKRRRKAARNCAKTHLKMKRQRRDFLFKTAKPYAEGYQRICVEDLNINGMLQNHHLAKSIADASWGTFVEILEDKAARAGHQVVKVPARFTSQKCHQCGEIVQKSLSVRTHLYPSCSYVEDRDVNAAKNILQAGAPPSGTMDDSSSDELRSPDL
ncbi:MAG TPA: transposase [Ktedonobacterales bacterium]|nr:transposase [Ktedonobacterales bacterium]